MLFTPFALLKQAIVRDKNKKSVSSKLLETDRNPRYHSNCIQKDATSSGSNKPFAVTPQTRGERLKKLRIPGSEVMCIGKLRHWLAAPANSL